MSGVRYNNALLCVTRRNGQAIAFTLAEVLITLGVIGVVAALTLPSLIQNYREKETVAKVKKAYSLISNAYMLAKNEHGDLSGWFTEISENDINEDGTSAWSEAAQRNADILWDKISPYLNVASRCKTSDNTCQKYDDIYTLSGKSFINNPKLYPVLTLNDGMTFYGGWVNLDSYCKDSKNPDCGDIAVDINGLKNGPNTIGKDIFPFYIAGEYIVPQKPSTSQMNTSCNLTATGNYNGFGCTSWVITNENMDYLHCNDLSWDGKIKCK